MVGHFEVRVGGETYYFTGYKTKYYPARTDVRMDYSCPEEGGEIIVEELFDSEHTAVIEPDPELWRNVERAATERYGGPRTFGEPDYSTLAQEDAGWE